MDCSKEYLLIKKEKGSGRYLSQITFIVTEGSDHVIFRLPVLLLGFCLYIWWKQITSFLLLDYWYIDVFTYRNSFPQNLMKLFSYREEYIVASHQYIHAFWMSEAEL